eukprot:1029296-Amorphochlora_amoeboformis.AAC.1
MCWEPVMSHHIRGPRAHLILDTCSTHAQHMLTTCSSQITTAHNSSPHAHHMLTSYLTHAQQLTTATHAHQSHAHLKLETCPTRVSSPQLATCSPHT